ncbi:MAG TPA: flavodoxin domain-containing protein [Bacteroidia bacterium]|jgi:flavodoxin|nr:flavodoxin domain-containing protein [Bacteroidia bacterium]
METLIVYDSNYGNTEKVAKFIEKQFTNGAKAVSVDKLQESDWTGVKLLIVGSPIHAWRPSEKTSSFIKGLSPDKLKGILVTGFDTRVKSIFSGDAATKIAKGLKLHGARLIASPIGLRVKGKEGPLLKGELHRAVVWTNLIKSNLNMRFYNPAKSHALSPDYGTYPESRAVMARWQRLTLLFILAYEGAGGLLGGTLLLIAPDGRLMDMPVHIMHGAFIDFFIPGLILLGLGILNSYAFIALLRRSRFAWIATGLAMGGFLVWFAVEIIILQRLHWLHVMWGIPVVVGSFFAARLIPRKGAVKRFVMSSLRLKPEGVDSL